MRKIRLSTREPVRIDLGCGNKKKEGFIGFDMKKGSSADHVCDLTKGIPLPGNSVDEIYSSHFLEHVDDYNLIMKEMIRVCRNSARIEIVLPYYSYVGAVLHSFNDNPHRHIFSEAYFYWKDVNPCFDNYKVEEISYKFVYYRTLRKNPLKTIFYFIYNLLIPYDVKRTHFLNSVEEFRVVLRVKK